MSMQRDVLKKMVNRFDGDLIHLVERLVYLEGVAAAVDRILSQLNNDYIRTEMEAEFIREGLKEINEIWRN